MRDLKVERELLVVKFKYKNYEDKDIVSFSSIEMGGKQYHDIEFEEKKGNYGYTALC